MKVPALEPKLSAGFSASSFAAPKGAPPNENDDLLSAGFCVGGSGSPKEISRFAAATGAGAGTAALEEGSEVCPASGEGGETEGDGVKLNAGFVCGSGKVVVGVLENVAGGVEGFAGVPNENDEAGFDLASLPGSGASPPSCRS